MAEVIIEKLYGDLQPGLESLEKERLKATHKSSNLLKWLLISVVVLAIPMLYYRIFWLLIVLIVPAILAYVIGRNRFYKKYKNDYKNDILQAMVVSLGPNYRYDPLGKLDKDIYRKSGLFEKYTDTYCEDLIEGKLENYTFQQGDVKLSNQFKSSDTASGSSMEVFDGLFVSCTISLSFPDKIWIYEKKQGHKKTQGGKYKLHFDNPKFAEKFEAFSDVEQPTDNLLPQAMLESMVKVHQQLNGERINLAILDNSIFIAIYTHKQLFEAPIKIPVTDFERFKADFQYLNFTTHLIDQLLVLGQ